LTASDQRPEAEPRARRIAAVGECMIELSAAPELGVRILRRAFAGDTLNTAVYLRRCLARQRLAAPWSVAYVTRLGEDRLSAEMLCEWEREGIDTSLVRRDPKALPGLYLIESDDTGERQFSYWRETAPARLLMTGTGSEDIAASLAVYDALYVTGVSLAILPIEGRRRLLDVIAAMRRGGGRLAFDGNYRTRLWADEGEAAEWLGRAYGLADIALPGGDEVPLFGAASASALAQMLLRAGAGEVAVKQGGGPVVIADGEGTASVAPAPVRHIVDTTGAGDSFNAGYIAARFAGAPPHAAARFGHHLAGQVIGQRGAILSEGDLAIGPWQELP
jgi:2-dehydro-3-deoxygluconokinase